MLASWKRSPNLLVSLPAIKALANMDAEYGVHTFKPGIYMLGPQDRHVQHRNNLSNWGVDVVFIHGLWGGVFYTGDSRTRRTSGIVRLSLWRMMTVTASVGPGTGWRRTAGTMSGFWAATLTPT
eukprot:TRINITY_DN24681_c0_g1_i1.p2 TRINITY_DN24681_c0_g1~~TRINITY_DN24681_c0_g1_i1.p2  ORF type:complete len:124 (+),score=32.20 TRINITY_DN24681_c0_g1_i1:293-664(+)